MNDVTVLFLTCNDLPAYWEAYHQKILLEAVKDRPLITLSMKPMELGLNIVQDRPKSASNVYWQMLRGAKAAQTEYIAIAESDTLYHEEHFMKRPEKGTFGYNMNHWALFTWTDRTNPEPMYNWRNRRGNYSMIAERDLVIEALEERFAKWPDGTPDDRTGELGRNMMERNMGITERKASDFYTTISVINFNHDLALDPLQRRHRKNRGWIRAYDIPYWGKASDLVLHFR